MIKKIVPYSRQNIDSSDKNAVLKSLNQTFITQGPILENLEKEICKKLKVKYAVAVSSATAGLHICNLLFKNKRVLTQSLTFASTISTILYLLGVLLITTIKNVPLNNKLEKLNSNEFKGVFIWYRKPWNFWHNARTFFGMISFLMLIIYTTF